MTTRGFSKEDMEIIAEAISIVLKDRDLEHAKTLVASLTAAHPLPY